MFVTFWLMWTTDKLVIVFLMYETADTCENTSACVNTCSPRAKEECASMEKGDTLRAERRTTTWPEGWIHGSPSTCTGTSCSSVIRSCNMTHQARH